MHAHVHLEQRDSYSGIELLKSRVNNVKLSYTY